MNELVWRSRDQLAFEFKQLQCRRCVVLTDRREALIDDTVLHRGRLLKTLVGARSHPLLFFPSLYPQSVNQYALNTFVTIAHGYNKFENTSAKHAVAKDKEKCGVEFLQKLYQMPTLLSRIDKANALFKLLCFTL